MASLESHKSGKQSDSHIPIMEAGCWMTKKWSGKGCMVSEQICFRPWSNGLLGVVDSHAPLKWEFGATRIVIAKENIAMAHMRSLHGTYGSEK